METGDPRVTLEPLAPQHAEPLRAIRAEAEVERWWDPVEPDFPLEDDPDSTRFTVLVDGEIAGMVQFSEELEPKYRSAGIDLFLAARVHGRGVGSAAVRAVVEHLVRERGHHRITIDPAAENHAAVRCYEKAGFRRVGVLHLAERDADGAGWHDALLMELVVAPRSA